MAKYDHKGGNRPIAAKKDSSAILITDEQILADKRLRTRWERHHQYKMEAKGLEGKKRERKLQHSENNLAWYQESLAELEGFGIEYGLDHGDLGKYGEARLYIKSGKKS